MRGGDDVVVREHIAVIGNEKAAAAARLGAGLAEVVGVGHFRRDGDDLLARLIVDRSGGARVGADRLRHERAAGVGGGAAAGLAGAGDEPRNRAAAKAAEQRAHEAQARDARDEPLLFRRARSPGLSRAVLVLGLLGPGVVVRRVVARRGAARIVAGVEVCVLVAALGFGADDVIRHVLAAVDLCAAARAEARARLECRTALRAHAALCGAGPICRRLCLRGGVLRAFCLRGGGLGPCLCGSGFSFRLFAFGEIGSVVHVFLPPGCVVFEVSIS